MFRSVFPSGASKAITLPKKWIKDTQYVEIVEVDEDTVIVKKVK